MLPAGISIEDSKLVEWFVSFIFLFEIGFPPFGKDIYSIRCALFLLLSVYIVLYLGIAHTIENLSRGPYLCFNSLLKKMYSPKCTA